MNTQTNRNSVQPTVRNLRKHFLPLLLAVTGVLTGGSVGKAATAANIDFSTGYTAGNLVGANGWATYGTANTSPILVSSSGVALASVAGQSAYKQYTPYQFAESGGRLFIRMDINVTAASTGTTGADIFLLTREIDNSPAATKYQPQGKNYFRTYIKSSGSGFVLGWNPHNDTTAPTPPVFDTTVLNFNQTYTVLIRCDSTTGRNNDKSYLYVNPSYAADPTTLTPVLSRTSWTGNTDEFSYNVSSGTSGTPLTARLGGYLNVVLKQNSGNALTVSKIMVGDAMTDVGILPPAPGVPTSAAATSPGTGGFTANWAAVSSATGYYLDVATDSGFTSFVAGYDNKNVGNVVSSAVTGTFEGGTTLYYRVRAYNPTGTSANSAPQTVGITAVLYPTVSNATASGTVTWVNGPGWSPNKPVSASDATVTFNGALTAGATLTANNDSPGDFQLNSLVFSNSVTGTGTVNVTGNPFRFSANGTTNPTIIFTNNANLTQQVSNALQLDSSLTVTNAAAAILDGAISGTGALSKLGAGSLRLNAANSYAGGTTISSGTLQLGNNNALGTGSLTIAGGSTLSGTNGSKNITNPIVFLGNYTSLIAGVQKLDLTNQLSGNISGPGVIRNNTTFFTVYLANPTNSFDSVLISQGAIGANSFGVAGSPSPLGTNATINFGKDGVSILRYFGSGETNAKTLAFAPAATFSILENSGTGPIKFTSPLQILRTAPNTLILDAFSASGEFAASVTNLAGVNVAVDGTRLAKSGTGDWILSASNNYRNTSVQVGRLVAQDPNALPANRDVEMAGGTLLVNYTQPGATLGNLCLTNHKSASNRYTTEAETYKFNDSTIDLGTDRAATLVFSSATNWIVNQLTDPAATNTYGRNQYLKVANSAVGAGLYITNTNGVPLDRILCAEDTNLTAKITYSKRLIFVGSQTTPTITVVPTAAAITYGQTLAFSTLTGGSVSVPGAFEFTSPETAPIAGTATYQVIFIPSDETLYNTVTTTVSVTVNKANRTVTFPTAAAITYGQALGSATLTGGSTEGAFAFSAPASVPSAGVTQNFEVVFTPTDDVNYNYDKLTQQVAVTVNKADSTISTNPTGAAITVGQTLSSSALSGGSATGNNGVSLPGTFTWTEGNSTPAEGAGSYSVTFTPTDSANYRTASGTASVTVNPAPTGPTFANAFGGASATDLGPDGMANLLRYALGANSSSGSVVKPVTTLDANNLSITAIVRINDPKVTVVGESATDLASWNTTTIPGVADANQDGAIAGETQKQTFSVPRGASKTFLRLKATQTN